MQAGNYEINPLKIPNWRHFKASKFWILEMAPFVIFKGLFHNVLPNLQHKDINSYKLIIAKYFRSTYWQFLLGPWKLSGNSSCWISIEASRHSRSAKNSVMIQLYSNRGLCFNFFVLLLAYQSSFLDGWQWVLGSSLWRWRQYRKPPLSGTAKKTTFDPLFFGHLSQELEEAKHSFFYRSSFLY